ncbi:conjugal transfer protein TraR [Microbulbifer flavimaris]|uniref:Conjugal transfer protein TraR n=1 Tax=Microbulbifer flavimaris TaxID=1781068 RepID=A0ABX4I413_9GAMM|nr:MULTISPECIES: hypothetical protein [Microbulbifer]KUJ84185.1 hypothetical protein AVO43_00255 [Microbulbifer sp. ZGT114]PCO06259.1 conjugal transfer protein TraR [Microbulbifer flavimaris]
MQKKIYEDLKDQLLAMQSELSVTDVPDQTATVELDQSRVGRLSRIDALQSQQLAMEAERRRQRLRLAVDAALLRMEEGDCGLCCHCGDEIAIQRLQFDPTITGCINCAA